MPPPALEDLLQAARSWAAGDPDEAARTLVARWITEQNALELERSFAGQPSFGTAGMRGVERPGPLAMNRAVVLRVSYGLGRVLLDAAVVPRVAIAYDARRNSEAYARDAATALRTLGVAVELFSAPAPTPLLAYYVLARRCSAGICITASHNPKEYAGYKVYGPDGAQLSAPLDEQILEAMRKAPPATQIVSGELPSDAPSAHTVSIEQVLSDYVAALEVSLPHHRQPRPLRIAYTPLHGVGWHSFQRVMQSLGYTSLLPVSSQVEPDPDFPTLGFPNPEEPGTLGLALEHAEREHAQLLLVNDPDADRLAVAARDQAGDLERLTGDEVGVLLADHLLRNFMHGTDGTQAVLVNTLVSSRLLFSVARKYGAHAVSTLTGFKWILRAGLSEATQGRTFLFGYEEALGYCYDGLVRDKDGLSASVLFADLASECDRTGQTVWDRLLEIYQEHGVWASVQRTLPWAPALGRRAIDALAQGLPRDFNGVAVESSIDYRQGAEARPYYQPESDLLELVLSGGSRVLLRPSGTEPKLKIYVDLSLPPQMEQLLGARKAALGAAAGLADAVCEALRSAVR